MFDADRITKLDMFTRGAVGLTALVCVAAPLYSHLSLNLRGPALPVLALVLMAGLALSYGRWQPAGDDRAMRGSRVGRAPQSFADPAVFIGRPQMCALAQRAGISWLRIYRHVAVGAKKEA